MQGSRPGEMSTVNLDWLNWNVAAVAGTALAVGGTAVWMMRSGKGPVKKLPKCALSPEDYTKCKLVKVTPMSHNTAMYPATGAPCTYALDTGSSCPERSR